MRNSEPLRELFQKISSKHQKRFILYTDYIECIETKWSKEIKYTFGLEQVNDEPLNVKQRENAQRALWGIALCGFLLILALLSGKVETLRIMAFIGLCGSGSQYLQNRNKFLVYSRANGSELSFLPDNPTAADFNSFITEMVSLREKNLVKIFDSEKNGMPPELAKFHFLKEKGAITEEEFLKIKYDLLKDITGEKKSPGFLN